MAAGRGKSVFRLSLYIFRLKIYSFRLKLCIFRLKIKFAWDVGNYAYDKADVGLVCRYLRGGGKRKTVRMRNGIAYYLHTNNKNSNFAAAEEEKCPHSVRRINEEMSRPGCP